MEMEIEILAPGLKGIMFSKLGFRRMIMEFGGAAHEFLGDGTPL